MGAALIICSLALLCLAGAAEAWRLADRQRNQELSRGAVDRQLRASTPSTGQIPAPSESAYEMPWDGLLARAGLPPGVRIPLLVVAVGLALASAVALRLDSLWMIPITLGLYAIVLGFLMHRKIERRQRQIMRQVPDFLEHMVRLTALGNSLAMAFQNAAAHVPPPLRPILDSTLSATRAGMDLERALALAAQPQGLRMLEVLASVLGIGLKVGGRADQILQRMSDFMRDLEQAQQELVATTSETRASAWVIGMLPPLCALMMALTSPDFFTPMVEQPLGQKLLILAALMEAIGAFLLYRLARSL